MPFTDTDCPRGCGRKLYEHSRTGEITCAKCDQMKRVDEREREPGGGKLDRQQLERRMSKGETR